MNTSTSHTPTPFYTLPVTLFAAVLLVLAPLASVAAADPVDDEPLLNALLLPAVDGEGEDGAQLAVSWQGEAGARLNVTLRRQTDTEAAPEVLVQGHALDAGVNLLPLPSEPPLDARLSLRVTDAAGEEIAGRVWTVSELALSEAEGLHGSLEAGLGAGSDAAPQKAPEKAPGDDGFEWEATFYGPGLDSKVGAAVVWDDGNGPALYVGGSFLTAGQHQVNRIARWDGNEWSPLGTGMTGEFAFGSPYVAALTVFEGDLIAGGSFLEASGVPATNIARWDGSEWSPLGSGVGPGVSSVAALTIFDGDLIAGGNFTEAGGAPAIRIARWDGSEWSPLGQGMNDRVLSLAVFDGDLIAGGRFEEAGGAPVNHIARWNGSEWSPLGSGMDNDVNALAVFDGGLIAGGYFEEAGGASANHIARWDGSTWSPLGAGVGGSSSIPGFLPNVRSLSVIGGDLIVGGDFTEAGEEEANRIARWDGSTWSPLGAGMAGEEGTEIRSLTEFDGDLIAGGGMYKAGDVVARNIARWDGNEWSQLEESGSGTGVIGAGLSASSGVQVLSLTVFDSVLILGGEFVAVGGQLVNSIARWDGSEWSPLGSGLTRDGNLAVVNNLLVFEGDLIAGGHFTEAGGVPANLIARWDGSEWSALPGLGGQISPFVPGVSALAEFDGDLIAGGPFSEAGGEPANSIARWDGSAWSPLGSGVGDGAGGSGLVVALTVFDGDLIAGGDFLEAGGVPANLIARWDGSEWSALGTGMSGLFSDVRALTVFNGDLIAGGRFTEAGGVPVNNVARWDGSEWLDVGGGVTSAEPFLFIASLTVFNDALFASGNFTHAGKGRVNHVARWDGSEWSPLEGPTGTGVAGADDDVASVALVAFDADGPGPIPEKLVVGHHFSALQTGGVPSWHLGVYGPAHNIPPQVTVLAPADSATFEEGEAVAFAGSAVDVEDGDISGSLEWTSSLDGAIGTGDSLTVSTLSVGEHTITAAVTDSGAEPGSDAITVTIEGDIGTDDDPVTFRLTDPTPNPTQGSTTLMLRVPDAQDVTARVYDALGRHVTTLHDGSLAAGEEIRLEFDAAAVAAGAYVVRVEGEDFSETRRVTVVR